MQNKTLKTWKIWLRAKGMLPKKKKRLPPHVTIGRHSYGIHPENGLFAEKDARLSLGAFCSIAPGVKILCAGQHPTVSATTFPIENRLLDKAGGSAKRGEAARCQDRRRCLDRLRRRCPAWGNDWRRRCRRDECAFHERRSALRDGCRNASEDFAVPISAGNNRAPDVAALVGLG